MYWFNEKHIKPIIYEFKLGGISQESQFTNQPIIKICCDTGEKTEFPSLNQAAKDSNVSIPALKVRINTDVHAKVNGINYHWIYKHNERQ